MSRESITAGVTAGSKRRAATHYGPRYIEDKLPTRYVGGDGEEVLEVTFSYDDLPTYGTDEAIYRIPAHARIKSATLTVLDAFAGGTSYDVGLYTPAGVAIDADGLDAGVLLAAIDADHDAVAMDGALVGAVTGIGAAEGQIVVAATGTFTAGKARLRVVYEPEFDRA